MSEIHAGGARSVALGNNYAPIVTGDDAKIAMISRPAVDLPSAADIPAPPGTVKLGRARGATGLVGREDELAELSGAASGAQVVVGLGGSGKSTLAEVFAQQRCAHDNPVWWIDARTEELVETGLSELAARLDPVCAGVPEREAAAWARSWLAAHRGWLLVLDDVEDPAQAGSLLKQFPHGRFVLTSRRRTGWDGLAWAVRLRELGREQAVELLERVVRAESEEPPDLTGAAELCERLGRLPLAVEQAGAFIALNSSSPKRYLELLQDAAAQLLDDDSAYGDPARTVARIWRVNFDRLAEYPGVLDLLRALAWCAPNDIPRMRSGSGPQVVAREKALNRLAAYHLVTLTPDTISVHPLVQELLRAPDGTDPHRSGPAIEQARSEAIKMLLMEAAEFTDTSPEGWPARRKLFPHIEAVLANTGPGQSDDFLTIAVCGWLGQSLHSQGEYQRAVKYLSRSAQGFARRFGQDDVRTLQARLSLALALRDTSDAEAALVLQDILERATRSLGPAHEATFSTRSILADRWPAEDERAERVSELRAVLEAAVELYGRDHAFTELLEYRLATVLNPAGSLAEASDLAENYFRSALARFGPDDRRTLAAEHNFATALARAGDYAAAVLVFDDVVECREQVLGEGHPDTLISLSSLAACTAAIGRFERARELFERVLPRWERVLGPDHPSTRETRESLDALDDLLGSGSDQAAPPPAAE